MPSALFVIDYREDKFVSALRNEFFYFDAVKVATSHFQMRSHFEIYCVQQKITHVLTTSLQLFKLFDPNLEGSATNNHGAMVNAHIKFVPSASGQSLKVILIPPLQQLHTTNSGRFILKHWIKKLTKENYLIRAPRLVHVPYNPSLFEEIAAAPILGVDIETHKESLAIKSVAYSAPFKTYTLDLRNPAEWEYHLSVMRKINALPMPKVFQNGMYDNIYFLRFNAPITNWVGDTYHMMHCMYSELPRDLSFICAFFISNYRYWKDESATNLIEYNAKDSHYTLWAWLAMMRWNKTETPWAPKNYELEFPLVFPSLLCSLEGLKVDPEKREELRQKEIELRDTTRKSLETLLKLPNFNPSSPKQCKQLLHALGYKKAEKSDEKTLKQFGEKHPLFHRIAELILDYRGAVKAIGNYYESTLLDGRFLYQLDPGGTETGRMASRASSFWCGGNIQNQPAYCKPQYLADEGFTLVEPDYSQSESYCTAYISQDTALIDAVENSPDFHCHNASAFFGIPFNELYSVEESKVLNKPIRQLSKRVNHGANYNMGALVLLETMGTANVINAKHLLKLPQGMSLINVCAYLLQCFDKTYPKVRKDYYDAVVRELETTGKLVGATGWTRRTFLRPRKSKLDLNSAVAHSPQSLSVMNVNKAFMAVFKWQLETNSKLFRMKCQIHDSILVQAKIGEEKTVAKGIQDRMNIPCTIHGRTFHIPTDVDFYGERWNKS